MKQNPTFSYDRNTDLHQLLDFQKKKNQTLITGNTEMQKWTAQLNEDTYGKTGLEQRLVLGWMDGSKVRKWGHLSCTQLLQTTGVPLSALRSDSLCLVRDGSGNQNFYFSKILMLCLQFVLFIKS